MSSDVSKKTKKKPLPFAVGRVFWRMIPRRGYVRHEVRAFVDDRFVFRYWSVRGGGRWVYDVEPTFVWDIWTSPPSTIFFDANRAQSETKKWKAARL
jgi:hypothetical protein